jgi:restriction system protein
MAVPDFQSLMLPILKFARDGKDHTVRDAINTLAHEFELSDEDLRLRLPSGTQTTFGNRTNWACTYLKQAGLLQSTGRGHFQILQRGLEVLKTDPSKIDIGFLERFEEFVAFRSKSRQHPTRVQGGKETQEDQTPEELLEASYENLRAGLAQQLLERIRACSPAFFERLVVDLLVEMGYGGSREDAGEAVGHTGDGGIDGIIKEDKLGLDAVYIQAKRWENSVGRPIVQTFAGSLEGQRARKGVLITTSTFTQDARDYVTRIEKRIVLIDGQQLAGLMIDHGIGVTDIAQYRVSRVDSDYFEEEP